MEFFRRCGRTTKAQFNANNLRPEMGCQQQNHECWCFSDNNSSSNDCCHDTTTPGTDDCTHQSSTHFATAHHNTTADNLHADITCSYDPRTAWTNNSGADHFCTYDTSACYDPTTSDLQAYVGLCYNNPRTPWTNSGSDNSYSYYASTDHSSTKFTGTCYDTDNLHAYPSDICHDTTTNNFCNDTTTAITSKSGSTRPCVFAALALSLQLYKPLIGFLVSAPAKQADRSSSATFSLLLSVWWRQLQNVWIICDATQLDKLISSWFEEGLLSVFIRFFTACTASA